MVKLAQLVRASDCGSEGQYLEAGLSIAQLLCFNPNQSLDRKMKKIKAL